LEVLKSKLTSKNVAFVANRDATAPDGSVQSVVYFNCSTVTNVAYYVELKLKSGLNACKVTVKSQSKPYSELCKVTIAKLLA
jgi:CII-binding regulator of phage lambda lysogenization HflD